MQMKDIKFEEEKPKFFPVRLKRGYVPLDNPAFPKDPAGNTRKIPAGPDPVNLPIEEARKLIKMGIAERADEIEI
jgi:hypothetical protein